MNTKNLLVTLTILAVIITIIFKFKNDNKLPVIAIANYGPHSSLEASIEGIKSELTSQGFIEGQNIKYDIADVSFDPSLIPQMIAKLKGFHTKVMIVMTTPIAQYAKQHIKDIPLIYNAITDPIEAGLISNTNKADKNITGSSDKQDLNLLLDFVKKIIPTARKIGFLYSTSEINDKSLLNMLELAASRANMSVVSIPIDQSRDVQTRIQLFKEKVDFIYVGTSGPIQPTLPVISAEAKKMNIPVFNVEEGAVKSGLALASFGVDYKSVGKNAGKLVAQILNGTDIETIAPVYPKLQDHHGFISEKKVKELGISIPTELYNLERVK